MRRLSLARSPYYHYLETDDNFRRWVESLERGSITTAAVYYRRIGFLSSKLKVEPSQIAVMNTREARDFVHDTISYLETSGNVGSSIESYIKAVKSWLTWNDIELPKKVKTYGAAETPTVENEVTPVTNELRKIFEVGTLRARAVCGLMAFGLGSLTVAPQDNGSCPLQGIPPTTCDHAYFINGAYVWMRPLYTGLGIISLLFLASGAVLALYVRFGSRPDTGMPTSTS